MILFFCVFALIACFIIFWKEEAADAFSIRMAEPDLLSVQRIDTTYKSNGLSCGASLYLPTAVEKPPVVVMAHGFGGQRWMRLPAYARRFAREGVAVFVFDYRCFNDSEGAPQNYVNPRMHLEDWKAAIAHVRTLDMVDSGRIALWGTSFSGGHVIKTAAEDGNITAVISQVPFTDGFTTSLSYLATPMFALKAMVHGTMDLLLRLFSQKRHYVRIAGTPDEAFGMMCKEDTVSGLINLIGTDAGVSVEEMLPHYKCPADIVFTLSLYRPIQYAEKVKCPALVIGAEEDNLFPPDGPLKMSRKMKHATYVSLPIGHFDPYVGEPFEEVIVHMIDFLKTHLEDSHSQA